MPACSEVGEGVFILQEKIQPLVTCQLSKVVEEAGMPGVAPDGPVYDPAALALLPGQPAGTGWFTRMSPEEY